MDNLTHSLAGWALGQTGLKRKTRKGLAALILGANMPDIDVFFGWVPWEPLATHRGVTHGLVGGVLLLPSCCGAAVAARPLAGPARRGFKSGLAMRFGWLVALSYLGALTHPLLDWQTTYSVQLFSPFSGRWFHATPVHHRRVGVGWLGVAIWLSRRARSSGDATCAAPGPDALCGRLRLHLPQPRPQRGGPPVAPAIRRPRPSSPRPTRSILAAANELANAKRSPRPVGHYRPAWYRDRAAPDLMDDPARRRASATTRPSAHFLYWSILPVAQVPATPARHVAGRRRPYGLPVEGLVP